MIGIIILNYNTQNETVECVESIIRTTTSKYKIYIVDNCSSDNSYAHLSKMYSNSKAIEVIKSESNRGYSAGNNIGIKKALEEGAEIVILSNSDIVYFENSIDEINKYLDSNKNIGILGPKIILQDNSIQDSPRQNYNFANYLLGKKPFKFLDFMKINEKIYFRNYNYDQELIFKGLVSGCCIALSRKYFELCGYLDEGTFLYFEESIIANKAKNTELFSCVLPKSIVLHKSSLSIGNPNTAFSRYHRYYSSMYMLKKYEGINNIELLIIGFINLLPLAIIGFKNKSHRYYFKKLFFDIISLWKLRV